MPLQIIALKLLMFLHFKKLSHIFSAYSQYIVLQSTTGRNPPQIKWAFCPIQSLILTELAVTDLTINYFLLWARSLIITLH